jgi:hypothetical protein
MSDELNPNTIRHLLPRQNDDGAITPHHVLTAMNAMKEHIEEIYVVTKTKDGTWEISTSGCCTGLAQASLMMQEEWRRNGEE